MNNFSDMLPEEKDTGNQRVIAFLRQVTRGTQGDTIEDNTQALKRIEAHLFSPETPTTSQLLPVSRQRLQLSERRYTMESSSTRRTSKLLPRLATLVAVLCVITIVGSFFAVEQLARQGSTSGTIDTGSGVVSGTTIHLGPHSFSLASVVIKKGSYIRLANDVNVIHLLYNGYWHWNNGEPQPVFVTESGMPTIKNHILDKEHQELLLGPFTQEGLYHLFDDIHGDATLTIFVSNDKTGNIVVPSSLKDASFSSSTVTVKKGTYLRLVNDSSPEHALYNGYWASDGRVVQLTERGMPVITDNHFTIDASEHQEMWLGPFTVAGTFHLYDANHRGMNLVIAVK